MDTRGVEVAGNKICWEKRYQTRGRSGAGPLHRSIRRRERGACSLFRRELRHPLRGRLYLGRNGSLFTSVNTPRSRHSRKTFRRGVRMQPAPLSHTWQHFSGSLVPTLEGTHLQFQVRQVGPALPDHYFLCFSRQTLGLSHPALCIQTPWDTSAPPTPAPVPGRPASPRGLSTVSFQGRDSWTEMACCKPPSRKHVSEGHTLFLS